MSREMKTDHKSHKFDNLGPRTVVRLLKEYGIYNDDPRVSGRRLGPDPDDNKDQGRKLRNPTEVGCQNPTRG